MMIHLIIVVVSKKLLCDFVSVITCYTWLFSGFVIGNFIRDGIVLSAGSLLLLEKSHGAPISVL